jgi:hypothetical protein
MYFKCQVEEMCEDVTLEDENIQNYFLESGPTSAIWLRARDRSLSEEVCNYNAKSLEIESKRASFDISSKRPLRIEENKFEGNESEENEFHSS